MGALMSAKNLAVSRIAFLALLLVPVCASAMQQVTTCGQVVSGPSELAADLDCSAYAGDAITVERGPLYLRGHALIGNASGDPDFAAVECSNGVLVRRCRVVGPGEIRGASAGVRGGFVGISNALLVENVRGIVASRLRAEDIEISGSESMAISLYGPVIKSSIQRATISGNGAGVVAWSCGGCGSPAGVRIRDSIVSGNTGSGLHVAPLRLVIKNSDITGNALDQQAPECTEFAFSISGHLDGCADIASVALPRIDSSSTCATSFSAATGDAWGICTAD
jgi:hypothetical protein